MTGMGDNSKLTEQEHQALWGHHIRRALAARAKLDAAKAEAKENVKDAKNDGFSKSEIDDYIDLVKTDDPQKKIDKFNMMKRNAAKSKEAPEPDGDDPFAEAAE